MLYKWAFAICGFYTATRGRSHLSDQLPWKNQVLHIVQMKVLNPTTRTDKKAGLVGGSVFIVRQYQTDGKKFPKIHVSMKKKDIIHTQMAPQIPV